ncbi:hypothetical protein H0H92_015659, partial [Tricholoma furcatifolium]
WPVAIPVTFAILWTFAFLIITTALPALQSSSINKGKGNSERFPSPYRSPQSLLFLRPRDWKLKSETWLQSRTEDSSNKMKVLSHLESKPPVVKQEPFQYDTIEALRFIMANRSAESEKERKAVANCLAEVLPTHFDFFPEGDLADLFPFLSPSPYVPCEVPLKDLKSTTRDDLTAIVYLQMATCKGTPSQRDGLVLACIKTTRWLFEQPRTLNSVSGKLQPLNLISNP